MNDRPEYMDRPAAETEPKPVYCSSCGQANVGTARHCIRCGTPMPGVVANTSYYVPQPQAPAAVSSLSRDNKRILGIAGSIVLAIGVFLPLVTLPIVGSMTYINNGKGDGIIVLGLAVVSIILVLMGKYSGLWVTSILSLALTVYAFFNVSNNLAKLQDNPFASAAQMSFGWIVLLVGIGLLIAAAAMKAEPEPAPAR